MTTEGLRRHLLLGRALRPRVPGCVVVSSLVSSVCVRPSSCTRINAEMQVADVNVIWRTVIPSPENRKSDGSIPRPGGKL